jgi:predicted transcriptional regulator
MAGLFCCRSKDAICGTLYGMTKTTVYLDSDIVLALRQMAETQGRSQAELIRDALGEYTRRSKRPKIPGIGEFDSGHTDTSESADQLLSRAAKDRQWR